MKQTLILFAALACVIHTATADNDLEKRQGSDSNTATATATTGPSTPLINECQVIHDTWSSYPSSPSACCTSRGITCIDGLVSQISLSSGAQVGPIPNFILFTKLTYLSLTGNGHVGSIPSLPPSLQYLDLGSNQLTGSLPYLPSTLTYIQLSKNRLSGSIPTSIITLGSLQFLDVSSNTLTGLIPQFPSSLTQSGLWGGYPKSLNGNCFTNSQDYSVVNANSCAPTAGVPGANPPPTSSSTPPSPGGVGPPPVTSITPIVAQNTGEGNSVPTGTDNKAMNTGMPAPTAGSGPNPHPPGPPTPQSDSPSNTGVIAGGVAGGVVALVLIVVVGAYRMKDGSKTGDQEMQYFPTPENSNSPEVFPSPPPMVDLKVDQGANIDILTPPLEKDVGRKPLPGRIWGTR
ncbi:L domain-like protein [Rhizoclosmatium globosum]|uniref:L domain-like protein n=1 Tax=Rhizoclosmatium globosum TaxID=329046 RepID=A0A1Y2C5H9_9FUNG|nr:L domain-like protein [Rhizoclosmatium globosum]|eukprot:ORY42196.1 L domain-like protein [Rhizoclosmatium globosum]